MFTDGVSEAMDEQSNLFEDRRIIEQLSSLDGNDPEEAVNGLTATIAEFAGEAPQSDDITVLAFRYDYEVETEAKKQFDIDIRNELPEIKRVTEAFEEYAEKVGIPTPITMKVNLVFDELLNNIISYGYPESGEHKISIRVEKSPDRLLIVVEDHGVPFNPFTQADVDTDLSVDDREIGGLGIHLVKNVMDEFSYERHLDTNVVTLIKRFEN